MSLYSVFLEGLSGSRGFPLLIPADSGYCGFVISGGLRLSLFYNPSTEDITVFSIIGILVGIADAKVNELYQLLAGALAAITFHKLKYSS